MRKFLLYNVAMKIFNLLPRIKICAAIKFFEVSSIVLAAKFLSDAIIFLSPKFLAEFFLCLALRFFLQNLSEKKFLLLSLELQTSVRKKLHEKILREEIPSGEILTLVFDTLQSSEEFFRKVMPHAVEVIIFLPIFLLAAIFSDALTAAIFFVTLPISPILLWLIGKVTAEKNSRAWTELQKLNGDFKEILSAAVTLKIFGRIDFAAKKIRETSEKSSAATLDVLKLAFVSSFALELITTLSVALVAVTLGLRLVAGSVDFSATLFLLIIAPEFFLPIRRLGIAFHVIISAKSSVERLEKFLQSEEEKISSVEKIKLPPEISVENVSYTYPRKKSPALREINLKIPAGKITAIVGESGAGKSTLLKLLAGVILPGEGEIFFGELPTSKMQRKSLWQKISYAPQAPHLFDAPLAENFSMFGQLDTKNLEKLLAATGLENLKLSEEQKLSRGQLQRLGIIRALLKDSSLIILDEPTAGLDAETEKKILSVLKNFSPRRTVLIATHRQAVIDFADVVVKIEVKD